MPSIAMPAAAQAQTRSDGTASVVRIEVLTRERVPEMIPLMYDGFGSKACCLCCTGDFSEVSSRCVEGYAGYPDKKLAACAVAVEYPPAVAPGSSGGHVVGFCQLTLPGLPGDYEVPGWLTGRLDSDEGHVDRIVVSAQIRGRGIGKQLLDWADDVCRAWQSSGGAAVADTNRNARVEPLAGTAQGQRVTKISLDVVHGNPAQRLYERHGYRVAEQSCCERWANTCIVYFLMRRCGAQTMVKHLYTAE
jgi:ribosomal protein S18 acetylase RimI-like enzyme